MAIITIGGNIGAGKTTLAAKLAAALGYQELYIGEIFREMAAERRMTIEAFYVELKHDPTLERSVDERQATLMKEKDNVVIQGRVAWFFAKQSPFKVINILLKVDPAVGAGRVTERPENIGKSLEAVAKATAERTITERERYRILYNIEDYFDPAHYDIILDTSYLNVDAVVKVIMGKISKTI